LENIKVKDDFNYNSLAYYPFLDAEEMFKQYTMSDSNILLLCGKPGVGKCLEGSEEIEIEIEDSVYKKFFSDCLVLESI
jgi:SpoVK/Ycf46/Vps4 family AAA+-type ATPase